MATLANNQGFFTNTTPVVIVPSPPANMIRNVQGLYVFDLDTANVTVTLTFKKVATNHPLVEETLKKRTSLILLSAVLDDTDEQLTGVLAAIVALNQPSFYVFWSDIPV